MQPWSIDVTAENWRDCEPLKAACRLDDGVSSDLYHEVRRHRERSVPRRRPARRTVEPPKASSPYRSNVKRWEVDDDETNPTAPCADVPDTRATSRVDRPTRQGSVIEVRRVAEGERSERGSGVEVGSFGLPG
jgi:hypothetical protein